MDDQILEFFLWGARSWVGGASNFLPEEHVAFYRACVIERDFEKGLILMKRLLPMLSLLEQGGKFCQYIKLPGRHARAGHGPSPAGRAGPRSGRNYAGECRSL